MILQLVGFIVGCATSVMSFFGTLMISQNVSLLSFLIVWQIFMIMFWLLNRMSRGNGSHGNSRFDSRTSEDNRG